jgi:hypothetical protein
MGSHELFAQIGFKPQSSQFSASQVARITGLNHWCPTMVSVLFILTSGNCFDFPCSRLLNCCCCFLFTQKQGGCSHFFSWVLEIKSKALCMLAIHYYLVIPPVPNILLLIAFLAILSWILCFETGILNHKNKSSNSNITDLLILLVKKKKSPRNNRS